MEDSILQIKTFICILQNGLLHANRKQSALSSFATRYSWLFRITNKQEKKTINVKIDDDANECHRVYDLTQRLLSSIILLLLLLSIMYTRL